MEKEIINLHAFWQGNFFCFIFRLLLAYSSWDQEKNCTFFVFYTEIGVMYYIFFCILFIKCEIPYDEFARDECKCTSSREEKASNTIN